MPVLSLYYSSLWKMCDCFIPACKVSFFVHEYIVHIDALFVLWFGLKVSLYCFALVALFPFPFGSAHVDCNKSALTNPISFYKLPVNITYQSHSRR